MIWKNPIKAFRNLLNVEFSRSLCWTARNELNGIVLVGAGHVGNCRGFSGIVEDCRGLSKIVRRRLVLYPDQNGLIELCDRFHLAVCDSERSQ